MILDQYGQPWKFAHGADRDRRRGPQFSDRTADIDKLIPIQDARNLRALSKRLYQNMGVPRAAVNQKADYSVGEAWRPTYVGPSDFADGKAVANFLTKTWLPQCNVKGGCFDWHKTLELTSKAIDRDGDEFWLLVVGKDKFPRIQQIPAHRVGNGPDASASKVSSGKYKGYWLRDGVIQNNEGRAVAYRILTGENYEGFTDVDAANVIHPFDPDYSDQGRGLPAFTHALENLKSSLASISDERLRMGIISRLYLTVFNETGGPDMDDPLNTMGLNGSQTTGVAAQEIPGGIVYMTAGSGEKMEQLKHETPGQAWADFQDFLIRDSLAGVSWAYSMVWKSSGQGTSERSEILKCRRAVVRRQKQLAYAARRALAWAYSVFVKNGRVPILDHPFAWEFSKPPRLTVDDGREAKMELEEWRAGVRNTGDITESKLGLTEDEFYMARAHSVAKRKVIAKQVSEEYTKSSGYEIEIEDREMVLLTPNEVAEKETPDMPETQTTKTDDSDSE